MEADFCGRPTSGASDANGANASSAGASNSDANSDGANNDDATKRFQYAAHRRLQLAF
jgi:hypothetical protein